MLVLFSTIIPLLPRKYVVPMLSCKKIALVSRLARSFGSTAIVCANHYEVLGLTPKANQNAIKTAYYKLSMMHHPDKSSDAESAKKFRDITAAYEVLGNINLKKMYDKGLLVGRDKRNRIDFQPEPEPTDPSLKFYKSRITRSVTPTMDGRTPIYDFDAWAKNHYGQILQNSRREREIVKQRKERRKDLESTANQEVYLYAIFTLVSLFLFMVLRGQEDYDKVQPDVNVNNSSKK